MSEMQHRKWILKKVEKLENETLEETCKRIFEEQLDEEDQNKFGMSFLSFKEFLLNECTDSFSGYFVYNNTLYELENIENVYEEDDIFKAKVLDESTIEFEIQFYDGWLDWKTAIEYAIESLDEENK